MLYLRVFFKRSRRGIAWWSRAYFGETGMRFSGLGFEVAVLGLGYQGSGFSTFNKYVSSRAPGSTHRLHSGSCLGCLSRVLIR